MQLAAFQSYHMSYAEHRGSDRASAGLEQQIKPSMTDQMWIVSLVPHSTLIWALLCYGAEGNAIYVWNNNVM